VIRRGIDKKEMIHIINNTTRIVRIMKPQNTNT